MSMMSIGLRQVLIQTQRQELVLRQTLVGGASSSIFVRAEKLLMSSSGHQAALEHLTDWRTGKRYRSLMDFLFCELFPEWRDPCRWFYSDMGPQLRVYLKEDTINRFDIALVIALELAFQFGEQVRPRRGWQVFKREFAALPESSLIDRPE